MKKYVDPQGRHIRVYVKLLHSPAWRVLGFSAKALFTDLRAIVTGTNNGNISAALSDMKHKGWTAPTTLAKALYELRAMGFIAVTVEGGLRQGTRVPSLYRFTDLEVFEQPKVGVLAMKATHDYARFESVREAEQALAEGFEKLQAAGRKKQQSNKKTPVQKMYRSNTESVSEAQISNT
ncbi:hypothetical protein OVY01_18480 [Robbsia sp. Bb-Pol-6]|uniref:Replication protein n=1 Tax=Robbsia betulipollinis TaxID=2981849 RepID=A0ABT3ZRE6_9BURK|nr:hypothetical protein [Robbsia betulipollinis]MCY0389136.1 hypothetical protein [Robbsia betulipollinis]